MVKSASEGKLFYADASKGYTIKVLIDFLSGDLSRATFCLGKTGITSRESNDNKNLLFDSSFPRENFREYKCKKELNISLNLKHLQKMIRNVKKKDSMTIFIRKDKQTHLGITIKPESASQKSNRSETVYIAIQHEKTIEKLDLPEICQVEDGVLRKVYGYPMVILASDFQKIKKITGVGREVVVKMQKNNYLSFSADTGVYSSDLEFGNIVEDPESDSGDEFEVDTEGISDNEEDIVEESKEVISSESEEEEEIYEKEDEDKPSGWYEASFYTNMMGLMVKLPSLCSQMQFYAPRFGYPLKIKMNAGTGNSILGTLQVYIKDIAMINRETDFSQDDEKN